MKSATTVKDHVCGMDIETANAAGKSEYKGQTYYFCGSKCKEKFDLNHHRLKAGGLLGD